MTPVSVMVISFWVNDKRGEGACGDVVGAVALGFDEGLLEGDDVGDGVGGSVGRGVGDGVGANVGDGVGDGVGGLVGGASSAWTTREF
jgi:hypothetical protein